MGNGRKIFVQLGAALALVVLGTPGFAGECHSDEVVLKGNGGQARFSAEIADTKAERAQGLMNRETMPISSSMLFVYPRPQFVGFWMKNTLIPLDMIFFDEAGIVKKIHHNAIPLDETPIVGGKDILAVLEIAGGLAKKIGIVEGWTIRHPAFDKEVAAWPC